MLAVAVAASAMVVAASWSWSSSALFRNDRGLSSTASEIGIFNYLPLLARVN
jgi:hypothetical protein